MRYLGIILIILGIVSIYFLIKKDGKVFKYILVPCVFICVVSLLLPVINIEDYPNISQINRLKKILPEGRSLDDLSEKEKRDVRSIAWYVNDEKYYPDYLNREDLIYLSGGTDYPKEEKIIRYSGFHEKINVEHYRGIESYNEGVRDDYKIVVNKIEYDLSSFKKELIDLYNKNEINIEKYLSDNRTIYLDESIDFYITRIYFDIDDDYFDIDGYILYK